MDSKANWLPPLAGIRVIEISQNVAGPWAGAILGALGAEVVKIEKPDGGDDARKWGPPFVTGSSPSFHAVNYGKSSVTVDLRDPEGVSWLKDQLKDADVLVHNMRPGAMDELGLDGRTLVAENPRLIYCEISAYGSHGPMKNATGYEQMVQAFSGMWSINGSHDGPPTRVGAPILDLGTGVWTALGCLAALQRRHQTGRGGLVDTALAETAVGWMNSHYSQFFATGKQPERHRSGGPILFIFEAFETSDGEIVVGAANDRLYAKLSSAVGHPEWAEDERFSGYLNRLKNKEEVLRLLSEAFATASTAEWLERLEAAGVPCAPINEFQQVTDSAQMQALDIFRKLPGVDHSVVGLPVSFDGIRPPIERPAPLLGADNERFGRPAPTGGDAPSDG